MALKDYQGSPTSLERADQFLLTLLQVPHLSEKLKNMIYWDEFEHAMNTCDIVSAFKITTPLKLIDFRKNRIRL